MVSYSSEPSTELGRVAAPAPLRAYSALRVQRGATHRAVSGALTRTIALARGLAGDGRRELGALERLESAAFAAASPLP
jgi:hypothetical protein